MDSRDRDFPRQGNELTSCQTSPSRKGPGVVESRGGAATGAGSSIGFPANRAFRSRTCPRLPLTARRRLAITPAEIDLILKTGNVSNGNREISSATVRCAPLPLPPPRSRREQNGPIRDPYCLASVAVDVTLTSMRRS